MIQSGTFCDQLLEQSLHNSVLLPAIRLLLRASEISHNLHQKQLVQFLCERHTLLHLLHSADILIRLIYCFHIRKTFTSILLYCYLLMLKWTACDCICRSFHSVSGVFWPHAGECGVRSFGPGFKRSHCHCHFTQDFPANVNSVQRRNKDRGRI